jgi:hypothetical protein
MKFKVVNCPDRDFKPYVERAAAFFAKQLIPDGRLRNRCFTKIRFDANIEEQGYCSVEEYNSRNQPRQFLIEIHPGLGAPSILEVLAHEMVHVKQYLTGQTNDQLNSWMGKRVNYEQTDYWDQPWEIDAHGRESGLITKFAIKEELWEVFDGFRNPDLPIVSTPIKWKR